MKRRREETAPLAVTASMIVTHTHTANVGEKNERKGNKNEIFAGDCLPNVCLLVSH